VSKNIIVINLVFDDYEIIKWSKIISSGIKSILK